MSVQKLEIRMTSTYLVPKPPDSEAALPNIGIVKQHYCPITQLWPPALEIVPHGLIGVKTVDVQQIHRAIGEMLQRFIESRMDQTGKCPVSRVVIGP